VSAHVLRFNCTPGRADQRVGEPLRFTMRLKGKRRADYSWAAPQQQFETTRSDILSNDCTD
jgi:hypothetical protein